MSNHGGARPGSGRKRKPPPGTAAQSDDSLEFLRGVMTDDKTDARLRVRAAIALAQYEHTKRHDGGKKEERERAAATASAGHFGSGAPPKLVVNNR